jgi:hypothetical protein
MNALFFSASRAKRQWNKSDGFPKIVRLNILCALAAKQPASIRRTREDRLNERSPDQMPLLHRQHIQLIDNAHIIPLHVLILTDAVTHWILSVVGCHQHLSRRDFSLKLFGRHPSHHENVHLLQLVNEGNIVQRAKPNGYGRGNRDCRGHEIPLEEVGKEVASYRLPVASENDSSLTTNN